MIVDGRKGMARDKGEGGVTDSVVDKEKQFNLQINLNCLVLFHSLMKVMMQQTSVDHHRDSLISANIKRI